jgi:muconolactone delta-isomerase
MFEHSLEHLWRKAGDVAGHGCADVEGEDKTEVVAVLLLSFPASDFSQLAMASAPRQLLPGQRW